MVTQSQIINIVVSADKPLVFEPHIRYQMMIDSFVNIRFINQTANNYLPDGFHFREQWWVCDEHVEEAELVLQVNVDSKITREKI